MYFLSVFSRHGYSQQTLRVGPSCHHHQRAETSIKVLLAGLAVAYSWCTFYLFIYIYIFFFAEASTIVLTHKIDRGIVTFN